MANVDGNEAGGQSGGYRIFHVEYCGAVALVDHTDNE